MVVESVGVRGFRNLADCEVELGPGLNLLWGANGAGKTNLLEATYTALAGRSCRTRDDRETIAFGELARAGRGDGRRRRPAPPLPLLDRAAPTGRRHLVDGAAAGPEAATCARRWRSSCPTAWRWSRARPAGRRAHLDGFCAALWPAPRRGPAPLRAGARPAQRAARPDPGRRRRDRRRLDAWDLELATAGIELAAVRAEAVERLAAGVRRRGGGARARRRTPRCATGRAARPTDADRARGRARRAPRDRPRPRLHRLGPAPRRARDRARRPLAAALRLAGPAAGRRCWRCCSPSAGRCSTTAARRR